MMPGVTTRKPPVNLRLWGRRTALMVCQAINIAMTVVFPAPVANLRADRDRSGLASLLAFARWSRNPLPTRPVCGANFAEPNGGLYRFNLAEEGPNTTELVVPPMLGAGGRSRGSPATGSGLVYVATAQPVGELR